MKAAEEELISNVLEAFNRRDFGAVVEGYHPDAWVHYPQSDELIEGRARLRAMLDAFDHPPTWTVREVRTSDQGVIVEADAHYGTGPPWKTVFIYEITEGLITSEVAYFAEQFDPPDWRAPFVRLKGGST